MSNKAMTTLFGTAILLAGGSSSLAFAHDCNPCAHPAPATVKIHATESGTFHEHLSPKDADGNVLGDLTITGTSVKVGLDWTNAADTTYTWGTHTTKYNSSQVVEKRH